MAETVLDVVLLPPRAVSARAEEVSGQVADRMGKLGNPSHFRLGEPFDGDRAAGVCEPHVSLFMLVVDTAEISEVCAAARGVAAVVPAVAARAYEYRHNPHGAPEVYYRKTPAWAALQRAVVTAVEPSRRGRLRAVDPAGERLAEVVAGRGGAAPERVRQLLEYGYDEIADRQADRFNPHVTLAWPKAASPRVEFDELPPPSAFDANYDRLAVHGMSSWGTCTALHAEFALVGAPTIGG